MFDLGMPDESSVALGINDLGVIVGQAAGQAFVESTNPPGPRMPLDILPFSTQPLDINDSGVIVGRAGRAFVYRDGQVTFLGPVDSYAIRIDNDGRIVGNIVVELGQTHAVFWDVDGTMLELDPLSGGYTKAAGLSWPLIVGSSSTIYGDHRAFVWQDGVMTDLGTLGGDVVAASGVNSCGQIVGNSLLAGNNQVHAFFYDGTTMYDLNDLVPADLGVVLTNAPDINDAGQIVANGCYKSRPNSNRAFLLSPVGGNAPRGRRVREHTTTVSPTDR